MTHKLLCCWHGKRLLMDGVWRQSRAAHVCSTMAAMASGENQLGARPPGFWIFNPDVDGSVAGVMLIVGPGKELSGLDATARQVCSGLQQCLRGVLTSGQRVLCISDAFSQDSADALMIDPDLPAQDCSRLRFVSQEGVSIAGPDVTMLMVRAYDDHLSTEDESGLGVLLVDMAYDMGAVMTAEANYHLQSLLQQSVGHVFASTVQGTGALVRAYGYQWGAAA